MSVINYNSTSITEQGLVHLARAKSLTKLTLNIATLSDIQLSRIAVFKQVESLDLHGMPGITDDGLEQIATLGNLRHLFLQDLSITDCGLRHLYAMTTLESLGLRRTHESDDGVNDLHKALPNCKLYWNP